MKEQSTYLKHSNQIHLSLYSISRVTDMLPIAFSLNAAGDIGTEGAIKLAEALKSNTSVTSFNLSGNTCVAYIRSHSIQKIGLVLKEPSN
jgi:hypothetical protein